MYTEHYTNPKNHGYLAKTKLASTVRKSTKAIQK